MENTRSGLKEFIKAHKTLCITIAAAVAAIIFATALAFPKKPPESDGSGYILQEFDPNEKPAAGSGAQVLALPSFSQEEIQQLKEELAGAHAALEAANANYNAEIQAREADKKALETAESKAARLESEKNRLLSDLKAKETELTLKTPPALDVVKIIGIYEGTGELATMTYEYEIMEMSKKEGNILTNKTLLYAIPGTLKMGVNFDEIKNGVTVSDTKKTVTVTIPGAYFISNEIDEANVQRYDVSRSLFSIVEDKDYLTVASSAKENAQQKAASDGMLVYAQRLAGLEIRGLIEPIASASGYQIVIVYE